MDSNDSSEQRNRLLASLSSNDLAVIRPYLQRVHLTVMQRLQLANRKIGAVYFIESGLASSITSDAGRFASGAIIGPEGMTGLPILLGTDRGPSEIIVHAEGYAQFISAQNFRKVILSNPSIHWCFLRYAHAFTVQSLYTAFANAQGRLEERVARWLLMAHDRLQTDDIPVTHKLFSLLLGVRRAGVTVALRNLEKRGSIRRSRGSITVLDRERLIGSANRLYGQPRVEFERLFGRMSPDHDVGFLVHHSAQRNVSANGSRSPTRKST
jgi:CRP-like cAMP-binding protein